MTPAGISCRTGTVPDWKGQWKARNKQARLRGPVCRTHPGEEGREVGGCGEPGVRL